MVDLSDALQPIIFKNVKPVQGELNVNDYIVATGNPSGRYLIDPVPMLWQNRLGPLADQPTGLRANLNPARLLSEAMGQVLGQPSGFLCDANNTPTTFEKRHCLWSLL